MFLEIIIAILVGITSGIFTGLIPGIHINLISIIIISNSSFLLEYFSPLSLAIIILAMAITHTFLDTIPSIFLGAPETETALSVLPGHKLLLQGLGYEAVMLTVIGSLLSLILAIISFPIFPYIINIVYPIIKKYIGYILIIISLFLIIREKGSKIWALILFILSGCLGISVFSITKINNPLFPLLSGLFGMSMLVLSIKDNVRIPPQKNTFSEIKLKELLKPLTASLISGSLCCFLPGLGPAQAAILGSQFVKKLTNKSFLILIGGLNTVNIIISFIILYIIQKSRNGAVLAISKIIENLSLNYLIIFILCCLIVGGIASFLAVFLSKKFSKIIEEIDYKRICLIIIFFISILVILLSGVLGFLILIISTSIGLIAPLKRIGRNHLMGCLILPVIFFFIL